MHRRKIGVDAMGREKERSYTYAYHQFDRRRRRHGVPGWVLESGSTQSRLHASLRASSSPEGA